MSSLRINAEQENSPHFITLTLIDWINVFTKPIYFDIINNSIKYCQQHKGLLIYEYVIMTNHMHMIAQTKEGHKLSKFIADFKRFTGDEIEKELERDNRHWILPLLRSTDTKRKGSKIQVWQSGNEPKVICTEKYLDKWSNYIWMNPVKEEYVNYPEEWRNGSARYRLQGEECPIDLDDMEI